MTADLLLLLSAVGIQTMISNSTAVVVCAGTVAITIAYIIPCLLRNQSIHQCVDAVSGPSVGDLELSGVNGDKTAGASGEQS